jgi:hypothetical protein
VFRIGFAEEVVRRFVSVLAWVLLGLLTAIVPAQAAGTSVHQHLSWSQRDAAVYVVSTMNLLRSRDGHTLAGILMQKYDVTQFNVYDDLASPDLYFIELKRDDGTTFGALAYQMGWSRPMSLSSSLDRFHLRRAPQSADAAYHSDPKALIGSFSSTVPS